MIIKDKTTITACAAIPKISILRFCFRNKAAAAENNGMSMIKESIFLFPIPSQLAHIDVRECLVNSKKENAHNKKRRDHVKRNAGFNEQRDAESGHRDQEEKTVFHYQKSQLLHHGLSARDNDKKSCQNHRESERQSRFGNHGDMIGNRSEEH